MSLTSFTKRLLRIAAIPLAIYVAFGTFIFLSQRSMLYFPSHAPATSALTPWLDGPRRIGCCREVPNCGAVWLMMHGNAGQAANRDYVLGRMSDQDSLYVLEYPGYGSREGSPCLDSMNQAAAEAYRLLRSRNPKTPVCVLGESIGSGPACSLAREETPPDKIVLVVPFDSLQRVASKRFFFLPVRLMLRDNWNNTESLKHFAGPIEIFAATGDTIIPIAHAETLAAETPGAHLISFPGGHNDWSRSELVRIRR